jgi:Tfp pilus assembly protein PilO
MILMDRRQQLIAIAVLVVLIVAGAIYEFGIPKYKEYQQMSADLRIKQAQMNSDRVIASSLRTEMAAYDQTKSDLNTTGKLFDTEMRDGSDEVLLGLRAASTGVTIDSVTPGIIVEKPNYLELPLELTASGNYLNVVAYYADLERLTNLTSLRIFKIVAAPTVDDDSNVNIDMSMVVFTAKTPTDRLTLEEIGNWAIGRDNVFEPLDGFGQVSAGAAQGGGTSQGGSNVQTPGLPSAPVLPQTPLEPFSSESLKRASGFVPAQPASAVPLQR